VTPLPEPTGDAGAAADPTTARSAGWQRLDRRMIVIDAVQVLVSFVPLTVAARVFGGSGGGGMLPLVAVAVSGVVGAAVDAYRWATTRYRVTDEMVERRSGLLLRSHRSVRRDRIRSVDVHAKLRHRLGGLRIIKIGAGQQAAAGEAAFDLDAVSVADAHALHTLLLHRPASDEPSADDPSRIDASIERMSSTAGHEQVLARFRSGWVVYNVFNVWAYAMAIGVLWGAWWLLPTVNLDPAGIIDGAADWDAIGPAWTIAIGVAAVTVVGVVGLGINFFVEHGNFELARVATDDGSTVLRTRRGLLTTREVTRDDQRLRGVQISEPLWWRWMGAADTTVITTGLNMNALSQPAAILPRGPLAVARPVAEAVLGVTPSPLDADLRAHPPAALRRRLGWATLTTVAIVGLLGWLVATAVIPPIAVTAGVVLWPVALAGAVVAYRSLGHAIGDQYLVVRSGLANRATTALQRTAVSTVAIRESVLQRRLGLRTVTVMTSAGYGAYEAPDLHRDDAITFAADAAPDTLTPFLTTDVGGGIGVDRGDRATGRRRRGPAG
jgi:putative membrane protein